MEKSKDRVEEYLRERCTALGKELVLMTEAGVLREMTVEEMAGELNEAFGALEPKRVLASMEMAFAVARGIDWAVKHPFKRRWRRVVKFWRLLSHE